MKTKKLLTPKTFDLENPSLKLQEPETAFIPGEETGEERYPCDERSFQKQGKHKQSRSRSLIKGFIFTLFLMMITFLFIDLWQVTLNLFQFNVLLACLVTLLNGCALVLFILILWREIRSWPKLKQQQQIRNLVSSALKLHQQAMETSQRGALNKAEALSLKAAIRMRKHYRSSIRLLDKQRHFNSRDLSALNGLEQLELLEIQILARLDKKARSCLIEATRDVALFTTVSPYALLDFLVSLWRNLRMIHNLMHIYGFHPGWWQTSRIFRKALSNILLAGTMEAGDGLLNSLIGNSLGSKISVQLGQGLINGLMTARLGLSTIDVIRPLPFLRTSRPSLGEISAEVVKKLHSRKKTQAYSASN